MFFSSVDYLSLPAFPETINFFRKSAVLYVEKLFDVSFNHSVWIPNPFTHKIKKPIVSGTIILKKCMFLILLYCTKSNFHNNIVFFYRNNLFFYSKILS